MVEPSDLEEVIGDVVESSTQPADTPVDPVFLDFPLSMHLEIDYGTNHSSDKQSGPSSSIASSMYQMAVGAKPVHPQVEQRHEQHHDVAQSVHMFDWYKPLSIFTSSDGSVIATRFGKIIFHRQTLLTNEVNQVVLSVGDIVTYPHVSANPHAIYNVHCIDRYESTGLPNIRLQRIIRHAPRTTKYLVPTADVFVCVPSKSVSLVVPFAASEYTFAKMWHARHNTNGPTVSRHKDPSDEEFAVIYQPTLSSDVPERQRYEYEREANVFDIVHLQRAPEQEAKRVLARSQDVHVHKHAHLVPVPKRECSRSKSTPIVELQNKRARGSMASSMASSSSRSVEHSQTNPYAAFAIKY